MKIKVLKVERFYDWKEGAIRASEVVVAIGEAIEFVYRLGDDDKPRLVSKTKYGVSILTRDTFYLRSEVWEKLNKIVWAIFSERRPVEFIQGKLF